MTEPNLTQESLGSYLKRQREERHTSMEQIAYATRIGVKMLRALEDDDHASLPAPTFVRGYLQAFAKYLKIDTQDLLTRYQDYLAASPENSSRAAIKSHYLYVKERYQEKHRLVLVTLLSMAMLSVAGTYFVLKAKKGHGRHSSHASDSKKNNANNLENGSTPTGEAEETKSQETQDLSTNHASTEKELPHSEPPVAIAEKPEPVVAAATAGPVSPGLTVLPDAVQPPSHEAKTKFNLLLKADKDVWLRYQIDEGEVKELTLREGKAMLLKANKVFKIFSGNLPALHGKLNGKELTSLSTIERSLSAILPFEEVPHYPLPLFPNLQKKTETGKETLENSTEKHPEESAEKPTALSDKTSSDNTLKP